MFNLFKKKEKIKRELPPGTIRKEFHFEGNVQNIGFRFEVQSHAMPLSITGYAKNNDDGSVTAQLQGNEKNINKVIKSLQSIVFRLTQLLKKTFHLIIMKRILVSSINLNNAHDLEHCFFVSRNNCVIPIESQQARYQRIP